MYYAAFTTRFRIDEPNRCPTSQNYYNEVLHCMFIQNNALKIALNKNNLYSTVDLHIEAKILPCKYRRLMMLQKITLNELKENVALVDTKDIRTRAHDGILLYVSLPKTELFRKSNCYNKPVIWNNLPTQIRCITELGEFKSQIKRYYIRMFLSDYNYYTITYW